MELKKYKAVTEGLLFATGKEGLNRKQLSKILDVDEMTVDLIMRMNNGD